MINTESLKMSGIINECVPLFRGLALGRYAISIGGSRGKGKHDENSDVDFRLFCDREVEDSDEKKRIWDLVQGVILKWKDRGVRIDGCWTRKISEIDMQLDSWLEGEIKPINKNWTIWGYHLLTDIHNQQIVEDPDGIILGWKARLQEYPVKLKKSIIEKHMGCLRHWHGDYHYLSKVKRKDFVFLSGISSKIIHDIIQVLFALNDTYYCGDGNNADYIRKFKYKPLNFEERIKSVLYPQPSEDIFMKQREVLIGLIDEVEELLKVSCKE